MKKQRLFAILLALCIMLSTSLATANATNITSTNQPVRFCLDNGVVTDIGAYLDMNGRVRVNSSVPLLRLFPNELNGVVIAYSPEEGIDVLKYIESFGYNYELRNQVLYVFTKKTQNPGSTFQASDVFVNGLYVPKPQNGNVSIKVNGTVITFGEDFNKFFLSTPSISTAELDSLANSLGYSIAYTPNRIYLNNDGNIPVEIHLNGQVVKFPDQQPIAVSNRTLVPIRTISELLNCKVDWDNQQKCAIITKGQSKIVVWIGARSYWMNGTYYPLDVPAQGINGRTMLPLRFLAEAFGHQVSYYNSNGVFIVTLNS